MTRTWWYKLIFLTFMIVMAVLNVIPTIFPNIDAKKFVVKERINLGLDLQGGLYMIMGIDFPEVYKESITRNSGTIKARMKEKGFEMMDVKIDDKSDPMNPTFSFRLTDKSRAEDFRAIFKEEYGNDFVVALQQGERFTISFNVARLDFQRSRTVKQAIEVIRNRIDEFGVSEPVIASHGSEKILVELPGVKNIERAKALIGQTAKLEFKMVYSGSKIKAGEVEVLINKARDENKEKFSEGLELSAEVKHLNEILKKKLPEDTEIAFERLKDPTTNKVVGKRPYLLLKKVDVTGEDLQNAFVSIDQTNNQPFVSLSFNYRGAEKFAKLTGDNVGKNLAIVLDGIIHSAPNLTEKIPNGQARITMGRGNYQEIMKDAGDLAIVLRAGALPAKLEFQEQRVVGPSLGADSIAAGKKASLIAFALVLIFMIVYYRFSGIIANVALGLNSLFILAILVGLEATLTLPGIAGIALTLGMAVDANVIIYERIREELRNGKSSIAALEQGFARAISTILDANITTAVAALVLMEFGSGPIRGFAVTLLIGIVTSLFTAVFVSRLLFDLWLGRPGRDEVAISI